MAAVPVVVPAELVARVTAFLGQTGNPSFAPQATEHVTVVAQMAMDYTRGRGFTSGEPSPSLQSVIVSASARLLANPEQLQYQVGSVAIRDAFDGWSPLEKTLLNQYRRTAS